MGWLHKEIFMPAGRWPHDFMIDARDVYLMRATLTRDTLHSYFTDEILYSRPHATARHFSSAPLPYIKRRMAARLLAISRFVKYTYTATLKEALLTSARYAVMLSATDIRGMAAPRRFRHAGHTKLRRILR